MNVSLRWEACRVPPPIPLTPFRQWHFPDGRAWTAFYQQTDHFLLRFPELADFAVSLDGREVRVWPTPGLDASTVEHLHLNQVLPLALSQQGALVLHGSAVSVEGHALVFLGESGRGKSTLAASFARAGSPFLTDDGLQIDWIGGVAHALPSHASLRLWPDSQEALLPPVVAQAPSLAHTDKTRWLAGSALPFCPQAQPVKQVFFLGPGTAEGITITRTPPARAMGQLAMHSFLLGSQAPGPLTRQFDQLSQLAARPLFFDLDFPRQYGWLPQLHQRLREHAG
jgi:hypothetical protein